MKQDSIHFFLDETLNGSSKISSISVFNVDLELVDFGFVFSVDLAELDTVLKISSIFKTHMNYYPEIIQI